jgi:hypothetical protein
LVVDVSPGLHLAVTTAVIAGVSWLMILQGIEKKLIVRRQAPSTHQLWWVWPLVVALRERARRDVRRTKGAK